MIPAGFEPKILTFPEVDSTNLKMKELARKGLAEGSVIIAETQTAGRGRSNRQWHSPKGGLYYSVFLYPKDPKRPTDLALLAGTALAQAVKELLPKSKDVTVKWPNDVLIDWKKAGGILCESLGATAANGCVVGIGLNVNVPKEELTEFEQNPFSATSMKVETENSEFPLEEVVKVLNRKLFTLYQLYHEKGFGPIQYLWEKNCRMIGKKIELRDSGWRDSVGAGQSQYGVTVGTFLGIDEAGAMLLANARGERFQYSSGEITCYWL